MVGSMNREIKFRAYIKDGFPKGMHEVTSLFPRRKSLQCTFERYTFDEVELMQFTGLKDKNDIEIYEGDILNHNGDLWVVRYSEEDGMFILYYDNIIENFSNMNSKWLEVIGNIYENPELLKESEE